MTISRFRGDTFPIRYVIKDSEDNPIDITGWSFLLTINSDSEPADATNQVEQITGVLTDAANGEVAFTFPSSIAVGCNFYDIQSTDGSGNIRTHKKGEITIEQDITK